MYRIIHVYLDGQYNFHGRPFMKQFYGLALYSNKFFMNFQDIFDMYIVLDKYIINGETGKVPHKTGYS